MMFGALAAAFGWDRVGAALAHLARKPLRIAALRYVDDLFGPCAPAVKEHAMASLARLVRLLLGPRAVSDKKLECGGALEILGLHLSISVAGKASHCPVLVELLWLRFTIFLHLVKTLAIRFVYSAHI